MRAYCLTAVVGLLAWLPSCSNSAGEGEYPGQGELVVGWTLEGATNPDACRQRFAGSIDIIVYAFNGRLAGEYRKDCTAFETSIPLIPDDYTAEASLLDNSGNRRTSAVSLGRFSIYGNDVWRSSADFPVSSFY